MEHDFGTRLTFGNRVTRQELENRLDQLKQSLRKNFKGGGVYEDDSNKSEWVVDVTVSCTISLASLQAMNRIMKAFNVIQVWTSGGKHDKGDGNTAYYRLQFIY